MATPRRYRRRCVIAGIGRLSVQLTALDLLVKERIEREGPLPYDEVVRQALYDTDHGFYSTGGRAGRRGDFITSPEVGPLFGVLLGVAIDREWNSLGQPNPFTIVDVGAGPGTLARGIHAASPACLDVLDYVAVELSEQQRSLHPAWVTSTPDMPTGVTGVVIANELLDNMPFVPVQRRSGGLVPIEVNVVDGQLVEQPSSVAPPALNAAFLRDLDAAVWQDSARAWVQDVLDRVLDRGRLIVIDYARVRSEDVEIRTYAEHGRAGEPLSGLGSKDITVDVDLEQLQSTTRRADALTTQARWLHQLGVEEFVEEGRRIWETGAAVGDLASLRARSRIREAEALTDVDGLGGFWVAEWSVHGEM